jgi:hypothetical protein
MAKYRKKPVVIEAVQLTWGTWSEVCDFVSVGRLDEGKPQGCYLDMLGYPLPGDGTSERMGLLIPTKEGLMTASEYDWIIRGVKGELYPCKPDIFEATYDLVEETP